ncbi:MAG: acylneuraminate cytidylyltransferase family protein [Patescibacteria group bacterium]|nr:acylneuraminate cytidylyltransferase family protein [Patescibacteria group bacterium]MDE2218332.1 acylneuraminate cytidylyltransferase family protein [Patescibacteria group bacterium]
MKIIAIIPARGGSKRISGKNIINFCGKPLLTWTIEHARNSKFINNVYVVTDNEKIAKVAKKSGAEIIEEPSEIASDLSTSESALIYALSKINKKTSNDKIDYVVFLQATSPLRETKDIDNAINKIISEKGDSLFGGAELGDFCIWKESIDHELESVNYDYKNRKRSQEFDRQFVENGSIYVFKPKILSKLNNRLGGKILISLMEFWKSFEIDEPDDIVLCEKIFKIKGLDKKIKIWKNKDKFF